MITNKQERKRLLGRFRITIFRAKQKGDTELADAFERKRAIIKELSQEKRK